MSRRRRQKSFSSRNLLWAARESLRYGFEDRDFGEITAHADARNAGSIHVLRKLGFKKTSQGVEQGHEVLCFGLKRSEFRS